MNKSEKPPIGLVPKWLHEEIVMTKRMNDILEAVTRYNFANYPVPIEWLEEYTTLKVELTQRAKQHDCPP